LILVFNYELSICFQVVKKLRYNNVICNRAKDATLSTAGLHPGASSLHSATARAGNGGTVLIFKGISTEEAV